MKPRLDRIRIVERREGGPRENCAAFYAGPAHEENIAWTVVLLK
jgi:hypothetical protein